MLGCLLGVPSGSMAQLCENPLQLQWQADLPSSCNEQVMTMLPDQLGRSYLYVANKSAGLRVYDISEITHPSLLSQLPTSEYAGLDVINLAQRETLLFLALGNIFSNNQQSGMAIVDVSKPEAPAVRDFFVLQGPRGGAGIVQVEGNYAYLGAMGNGLVILDIRNPDHIQFVSQFIPDINYPVPDPTPSLYNLRGLEVKAGMVYACYDAGGLRIIDCTQPSQPVEVGRFANPALYQPVNLPRAYNNLVLNGSLAYVAVDYCGVEVLDVSDPANIGLLGWWNPFNCPNNNWFTSPVHANEIRLDANSQLLFVSTGKSDLRILDISNPLFPVVCEAFDGLANDIGSWGIHAAGTHVFVSYICVPLGIPFSSNWTGVKIYGYTRSATPVAPVGGAGMEVFPNPAREVLHIVRQSGGPCQLEMWDMHGRKLWEMGVTEREIALPLPLAGGLYVLHLRSGRQGVSRKIRVLDGDN